MKTFTHELSRFLWQQIVVGLVISAAILAEQVNLGIIPREAIHNNLVAFAKPYLYALLLLLLWHILRTSYVLYGEQQAEVLNLKSALSAVSSDLQDSNKSLMRKRSAEWKDMADRFKGFRFPVRADYNTSQGFVEWRVVADSECQSLCMRAGAMLPMSPSLLSAADLATQSSPDHLYRWLNYVKHKRGMDRLEYAIEELPDGKKRVFYFGSISDICALSSNICMECSAHEI